MLKSFMDSDYVKKYLGDVTKQIKYKPVCSKIEKELNEHIEDSALELIKNGVPEEQAVFQAVKRLGDAATVGCEMNDAYSLQKNTFLYFLLGGGLFLGIIANFLCGYDFGVSLYYIWGVCVLLSVITFGYRFLIQHTTTIYVVMVLYVLFLLSYTIFCRSGGEQPVLFHIFRSIVYMYNLKYLALPIFAVTLYKVRDDKPIKIVSSFLIILVPVLLGYFLNLKEYTISGEVIMIFSAIVLFYLFVGRGYFSLSKLKMGMIGVACFLFIGLVFVGCYSKNSNNYFIGKENTSVLDNAINLMVKPEKQATDVWKDGYNGVLIKELLARASMFGKVELTKEQMMEYGTGQWYFGNNSDACDKIIHYTTDTVTLEDILPQHYHNNYRIAYTILKYGWFVGIIFVAFLATMVVKLFQICFQIKYKLGHFLAASSVTVISFQVIFYILGNFGYQFGMFCNLPLISEGIVSITVNMILFGLIIAAYRYDRVIVVYEEKRCRKQSI